MYDPLKLEEMHVTVAVSDRTFGTARCVFVHLYGQALPYITAMLKLSPAEADELAKRLTAGAVEARIVLDSTIEEGVPS
jgi:hypothetical protein